MVIEQPTTYVFKNDQRDIFDKYVDPILLNGALINNLIVKVAEVVQRKLVHGVYKRQISDDKVQNSASLTHRGVLAHRAVNLFLFGFCDHKLFAHDSRCLFTLS